MVCNTNGSYPHKVQIPNDFKSSAVNKKGKFACHGYSFEENPDAFDMPPFTDRENSFGTEIILHSMGGLALICLLTKNCY